MNPRSAFTDNGFQDRRIQPLCHSSTYICAHIIGPHSKLWATELTISREPTINGGVPRTYKTIKKAPEIKRL